MLGILLVSHGKFAEGLKDSIELIMGTPEQFDIASLLAGQDIIEFREKVVQKIKKLDMGEGVLVFVDLFGASPYNVTQYASLVLKEENIQVRTLTGMNLPMLLETLGMRSSHAMEDIVKIAMETGQKGICEPKEFRVEEDIEGDY